MMRRFNWPMIVLICLSVVLGGGLDRRTLDALKVRHILRKIEMHPRRGSDQNHQAQVSEPEVNAYVEKRLGREGLTGIHDLSLTLLDRNSLKGKMKIDAGRLNLGRLFGDAWDVDFKGVLQTRNGRGRIDLESLRINGRPIAPRLVDMMIRAADAANGTSSAGIGDWYALPKGVKRITLMRGKALLHY